MFCSTINNVSLTLFKEVSFLCLRFCVDSPADRHIINLWLCVCQLRLPLRPKQRFSLETARRWREIKWQRAGRATQTSRLWDLAVSLKTLNTTTHSLSFLFQALSASNQRQDGFTGTRNHEAAHFPWSSRHCLMVEPEVAVHFAAPSSASTPTLTNQGGGYHQQDSCRKAHSVNMGAKMATQRDQ